MLLIRTVNIARNGISGTIRDSMTPEGEYQRANARERGILDARNNQVSVEDNVKL